MSFQAKENVKQLERKIDNGITLAEQSYRFEKGILDFKEKKDHYPSIKETRGIMTDDKYKINLPEDIEFLNYHYDENTGAFGIAVEDKQIGEVHIAYAGTNRDADGFKDVMTDIGLVTPTDSKLLNTTQNFMEKLEKENKITPKNISLVVGHSLGGVLATLFSLQNNISI